MARLTDILAGLRRRDTRSRRRSLLGLTADPSRRLRTQVPAVVESLEGRVLLHFSDITAPVLAIPGDIDPNVTNDNTPTFTGSATLGHGGTAIDPVTVELINADTGDVLNSTILSVQRGTGFTWSLAPTNPLDDGVYNIAVRLSHPPGTGDHVNSSASQSITIDTVAPVATIDPIDTVPLGDSVTITGTATDVGSGVHSVQVTITDQDGNEVDSGLATITNGTWEYEFEPAAVGSYTVVVTVTDVAGNEGTAESSFEVVAPATGIEVTASLVQSNMNLAMNGHFGIRLTANDGTSLQEGVFEGLGILVGGGTFEAERIELDADGLSVIAVFRMTPELRDALADLAKGDEATLTAGSGKSVNVSLSVGLTGTYDGQALEGTAALNFFINNSLRALLQELQALLAS